MKTNRVKLFAIMFFAIPLLAVTMLKVTPMRVSAISTDDPATMFHDNKCFACHTPNASKFFDPTKTEAELVQTILKGKKGEKPPYMPSFEAKGITEDAAKGLAAYMKSLRCPPATN